MNIVSSAFGHYEAIGDPMTADCLLGHSFGRTPEEGGVNQTLATMMIDQQARLEDMSGVTVPIMADVTLIDACRDSNYGSPYLVIMGESDEISNTLGTKGGTWDILVAQQQYMQENDLIRPAMYGHACHIGRVARQAKKVPGMPEMIIPEGLPRHFDASSEQPHTRSLMRFAPREIIGSLVVLRAKGQL